MQYNGGKQLVASEIATIINAFSPEVYWEPFVGCGSVIEKVRASKRIGSDLDSHIISYLQLTSYGWIPPDIQLDENQYKTWKSYQAQSPEDLAIKAMIGYGCSFGGKFFEGYARNKRGDDFWAIAKRRTLKRQLAGIEFRNQSFSSFIVEKPSLIYCDPPYATSTKVGTGTKFDSEFFWSWCLACAMDGITVLVSEFQPPSFAQEIWSKTKNKGFHRSDGTQNLNERLFMVTR